MVEFVWDEWVFTPFYSLHRWDVQPDRVTYPSKEVVGNDAIPLIQKLKYNNRLLPAMQQVFGKAMVCRDMECASRVSRQVSDAAWHRSSYATVVVLAFGTH